MRKAKKSNFYNRIALGSTLYKVAQMDCKTFIHRFDSDRRLHSLHIIRLAFSTLPEPLNNDLVTEANTLKTAMWRAGE